MRMYSWVRSVVQNLQEPWTLVKIDDDGELGLLNVGVCGVFVVRGSSASIAADGEFAEGDVDGFGIDLRAGVADGGHEASPIGIAAGPRGFDERGMGDGFGNTQGIGVGGCTVDAKFDDVRDAFAVGHDLAGE